MKNQKTCIVCGTETRYLSSDGDYEYWYSVCEHLEDYRVAVQ